MIGPPPARTASTTSCIARQRWPPRRCRRPTWPTPYPAARRSRGPVLVRRRPRTRRSVVLAEEDDGQAPHRGEVHRLVEGPWATAPSPKNATGHGAVGPQLGAVAAPTAMGRPAPRSRWPRRSRVRVGDVHRAATAAVGALVPGHQLGEHRRGVQPLGEAVPVAAVGGGDDVGGPQRPAGTHGRGLLPDGEVDEPRHLARPVQGRHPLLEPADHQHPPVELEQVVVRDHRTGIVLVGTRPGSP